MRHPRVSAVSKGIVAAQRTHESVCLNTSIVVECWNVILLDATRICGCMIFRYILRGCPGNTWETQLSFFQVGCFHFPQIIPCNSNAQQCVPHSDCDQGLDTITSWAHPHHTPNLYSSPQRNLMFDERSIISNRASHPDGFFSGRSHFCHYFIQGRREQM